MSQSIFSIEYCSISFDFQLKSICYFDNKILNDQSVNTEDQTYDWCLEFETVNICRTFFVHKIASIQRIRYKLIDADQEQQFIDADQERRFCS